ncbi:serine racemase-like isoform X2 [Branchiostoma lanceolatum]
MEAQRVTVQDVETAAGRLQGHARETPVLTCGTLDELAGRRLYFKCENLQKSGSFKFRGAYNAISKLVSSTNQKPPPVVTHSSGNHACALALAAHQLDVTAHVVMPRNAPQCKKETVRGYGGKVYECTPTEQARVETMERIAAEEGAVYLSSSQHPDIIAGQGTMGLELLRQVPDLDAVITCVGGGGMLAGVSTVMKSLNPHVRVYGAEPEQANDAATSLAKGERCPLPYYPDTIADGLRINMGPVAWPYIRDNVDDIITVTEEEIKNAMTLIWQRMKLVVEPSGVVGVAAALSDSFKAREETAKHVAVILSGGNLDLLKLPDLLSMSEHV